MQAHSLLLVALRASRRSRRGTLVVNANTTDPAPRAAWEDVVARFQADNPDIQVAVQHLRSRELQEVDPQLAHRRPSGRRLLVRRATGCGNS
jgi:ABC-type glycerol-3-phosphate transport system substrate-binding protein